MGETGKRQVPHVVVSVVTMGLLLLATPVLIGYGLIASVNSDACSSKPSLPICSPGTQQLVGLLPGGGAVAGLLVGVVGSVLAISHHRRPYPWLALGLVLPVAALVTATEIASTEPGESEAATAPVVRPAPVPAAPRTQKWVWHTPDRLRVKGVEPAGAGVVVAVEDGVIALDGVTGRERWHYRTAGAVRDGFAVSPDGAHVTVTYAGDAPLEVRMVILDTMTGAVVLDTTRDSLDFIENRLVATDHALVGMDLLDTEVRGFGPDSGGRRWNYGLPAGCELLEEYPNPVPGAGVVTVGVACGVDDDPTTDPTEEAWPVTVTVLGLDDRTGQERWRHTRDGVGTAELAPAGDGSAVFLRCDGFAVLIDTATGATLLDTPGMTEDNFVDATPEWLATTGRPDIGTHSLTTVDSQTTRSVTLDTPPALAGVPHEALAATDEQLLVLVAQPHADHATVLVQPWTGTPGWTTAVPVPHPGSGGDYELVLAPGALVATATDGTSVVGLA